MRWDYFIISICDPNQRAVFFSIIQRQPLWIAGMGLLVSGWGHVLLECIVVKLASREHDLGSPKSVKTTHLNPTYLLRGFPWWTAILLVEQILHQLRLVVYPSIYKNFIHPRWCRISSINIILATHKRKTTKTPSPQSNEKQIAISDFSPVAQPLNKNIYTPEV